MPVVSFQLQFCETQRRIAIIIITLPSPREHIVKPGDLPAKIYTPL